MPDNTDATVSREIPAEPTPIVPGLANPDVDAPKPVKSTKRSDAAQAFVASWLSRHPVAAGAFTAADAVALIEAVDAADPSKK